MQAEEGQLGVTLRPQDVPKTHTVGFLAYKQVASIAAGKFHSAALLMDGSVACWGQHYITGHTFTLQEPVVRLITSASTIIL